MPPKTTFPSTLPLAIVALLAGACDDPDVTISDDVVVDAEAEEILDETSPYRVAAGLAVGLEELDPGVIALAQTHLLVSASQMRGAEGWNGAELYPLALPLHRPDIDGPAYYEFKVVRDGEDAGFIVVSTGEHDNPLPEFNLRGPTIAEHIAQDATEPIARFYRLDAFLTIAEDEAGEVTAATSEQLPVPQVEAPSGDGAELADWSTWPALRDDFANGFEREIAAVRTAHADSWRDVEDLQRAARESATSDDAGFRTTWWSAWDQGATVYECENNWAGPDWGPFYPNDLTAHWQQMGGFRHVTTTGNWECASGCGGTAAGIILAWIDEQSRTPYSGVWSRPDMDRAFFRYRQSISIDQLPFVDFGRPPYIGLPWGWSMTSPVGLYDYSAAPPFEWVGQAPENQFSLTPQEDMRRYLLEIASSMRTGCIGDGSGITNWYHIWGLQRFLDDHKIPVDVSVDINVFGHPGVRDRVIDSLRNNGAPGFIYTGGLTYGHYEIVNAHQQCRVRDKANNNITWTGSHYFYTNKGWGAGNIDGWVAIGNLYQSAVFTPKSPWQKLVPSHSGQCADVPYGQTLNGLALQQVPCGDGQWMPQRWRFLPQTDGTYMIQNGTTNQCIEVYGYSVNNNASVVQWDCYGGNNQRWWAEMRADGQFQLRNRHSHKCLEVLNFGQAPGTALVQYTCDGASSQLWDLRL
jgi:hypothetical protein